MTRFPAHAVPPLRFATHSITPHGSPIVDARQQTVQNARKCRLSSSIPSRVTAIVRP